MKVEAIDEQEEEETADLERDGKDLGIQNYLKNLLVQPMNEQFIHSLMIAVDRAKEKDREATDAFIEELKKVVPRDLFQTFIDHLNFPEVKRGDQSFRNV